MLLKHLEPNQELRTETDKESLTVHVNLSSSQPLVLK